MKRDVTQLSNKEYDLLIIGGGIYGVTAAWDAASRGLSVALLDKGDFGSQNSFNSQKIIHGGLRYMQHGDFRRMRESIRERTFLMRIAPHLVHPMPCIIPTYGYIMKFIMPLALKTFDLFSFDRNQMDDPQKHIPKGKTISKEDCLSLIPGLPEKNITGGSIWHDSQVYNSERLVLSFIRSAEKAGANVANYVEVIDFLMNRNRVIGVKAKNLLNDEILEIQAKVVLNASGPWVDNIIGLSKTPCSHKTILSKMMVIVVNRIFVQDYAFGIKFKKQFKDEDDIVSKGYRFLFISPWKNYSLIGASQEPYQGDPEDFKITENDIQRFIEDLNEAYPHAELMQKDISLVYGGMIPIDKINPNGDVKVSKHNKILSHEEEGIEGLVSIVSVKYTTARNAAQTAVDMVFKKLGQKIPIYTTMKTPIYGGNIEKFDDFMQNAIENRPIELNKDIIQHLVYNYGSNYQDILKYLDENPILGQRIHNKLPIIKAEILYGIQEEMAQKLSDIILRRTELGSAEYPGEEALTVCAGIMAKELGWDESRIQMEIEEVKEIYTSVVHD